MAFAPAIAGVGMAASAAGGILGAAGSLFSGQAQSNMYNYQAGIAQMNAQVAQQNANYATEVGGIQAEDSGLKTRAEVGRTIAAQGAGNIDPNSGSAKLVRGSEIAIGQENQSVIRSDAAKRAYGFQVQGAEDTAQAGLYQMGASTAQTAGEIGAITSIIGGAGSVSSKWLQGSSSFGGGGGSQPYTGASDYAIY